MKDYEKFLITLFSFLLFATIAFLICLVYYLIQKEKLAAKNQALPLEYRIDAENLTPLSIVIAGTKEFRNLK